MDKKEIFNNNKLFRFLTDTEKYKLSSVSNIRTYPKNTFVFWQDEKIINGYIIVKGLVKIYRSFDNGKTKTISLRGQNNIVSVISMFYANEHLTTAQALANTTILSFPICVFNEIIKNNDEFLNEAKKIIQVKMRGILLDMGNTIYKNINGNLAVKLNRLADKFGIKNDDGTLINLKLSQQELADMVGTNRETICKALLAFKEEKSIMIKNKLITILDKNKLLKWQ